MLNPEFMQGKWADAIFRDFFQLWKNRKRVQVGALRFDLIEKKRWPRFQSQRS